MKAFLVLALVGAALAAPTTEEKWQRIKKSAYGAPCAGAAPGPLSPVALYLQAAPQPAPLPLHYRDTEHDTDMQRARTVDHHMSLDHARSMDHAISLDHARSMEHGRSAESARSYYDAPAAIAAAAAASAAAVPVPAVPVAVPAPPPPPAAILSLSPPVAAGPAVGVFPSAKLGGCAVPLLLSCSPNVVSGHLAHSAPAPVAYPSAYREDGDHSEHHKEMRENQDKTWPADNHKSDDFLNHNVNQHQQQNFL